MTHATPWSVNQYFVQPTWAVTILEERLASRDFVLGDKYSVIDGYALIVLGWSEPAKLSLAAYPNIRAYMARIEARPVIQRVRQIEGPIVW